MGCGSSQKKTEKVTDPQPIKKNPPASKPAAIGSGRENQGNEGTEELGAVPMPYHTYSFDLVGANGSVQYDTLTETLHVEQDANRYTTSELNWHKMEDEAAREMYYIMNMRDLFVTEIKDGSVTEMAPLVYKFKIDMEGNFVEVLDADILLIKAISNQGRDINKYSQQQKSMVLKQMENNLRRVWKSMVGNWVGLEKRLDTENINLEKATAFNSKCVFLSQFKPEDPNKVKDFLLDRLQDPAVVDKFKQKCLPLPTKSSSAINVSGQSINFINVDKSMEFNTLSIEDNLSPLIAMSINRGFVVFDIEHTHRMVDIVLDCKMHLFKWKYIDGVYQDSFLFEEINNFKQQITTFTQEIVEKLAQFNVPYKVVS